MKKIKDNYKIILVVLIVIAFLVLGIFIYKNIFEESSSNRLENIEKYKLTKKEINSVKDTVNELKNIEDVEVYANNKIIKIFIDLKEDIEFDDIKENSDKIIEKFSSKNLEFYDLEIFITSENEESKIYPKIGYKHKKNSKFTWNRW